MNEVRIQSICAINSYILLVFYTPGKCWQFRLISPDGSVFGSENIFYTPQAAKQEGISWVSTEK